MKSLHRVSDLLPGFAEAIYRGAWGLVAPILDDNSVAVASLAVTGVKMLAAKMVGAICCDDPASRSGNFREFNKAPCARSTRAATSSI